MKGKQKGRKRKGDRTQRKETKYTGSKQHREGRRTISRGDRTKRAREREIEIDRYVDR